MAKRHWGNTRTRPPSLPLVAPVAMLALLLAPAARADWKFVPGVELRETYSDNVKLESDQNARSQLITDLAPTMTIATNGPRLKLNAVAALHLYAYSNQRIEGTNSSHPELQASGRAKLVDDLLFLDGGASISQQAISAFGPQVTNSNGYANTNRAKVSTWRLSPYLAHRFGASAVSELRYTRDSVKSGSVGLGDSISDTLSASVTSGPAFHTIGWGLQASRQHVDDSLGRSYRIETSLASLHYRVAQTLTLDATGGYDQYQYASPGGASAGKSYSLGLTWTPSLRTSIKASVGKRYFGPSYLLALSHRSRRTVWAANYNDAVTTTREQLMIPAAVNAIDVLDRLFSTSIPDPEARRQAVDAYIRANGLPPSLAHNINYFSNRFILQRQFQATAAFNTAKTTSVVAVNASRRRALSALDADSALLESVPLELNDNVNQIGASVLVSYRLSPRSAVNLSVSRSRNESLSTGITDNQNVQSLSMTRLLQRKLKGAVELRHSQGNAALASGRKYRENAVSASLSYQL